MEGRKELEEAEAVQHRVLYNKQTRAWQQMMPCYIFSYGPSVQMSVRLSVFRMSRNHIWMLAINEKSAMF
ncbi:hypothetical protein ACLKA7_016115 [Drosophila subpalustris]